jgi:DNA-binding Lrp family transcriptional regulator
MSLDSTKVIRDIRRHAMSRRAVDRLAVKTLDQQFRYELREEFEMAPRVAQGVLEIAKDIFSLDGVSRDNSHRLRPGQIRQVIAAADAPFGAPLNQTEMVEVTWTVDAGEEDLEVLKKHGSRALRRVRILRLVGEALDQEGAATQEDLAKALGVTARTIRADIAALEAQGNRVVTRGKLRGAGRGQTHKAAIVELYLKRYTYTEIMRRARHSAYAIKRYIRTFGRVVMLRGKGLSTPEIAYAVGISERLAEEYLDLYRRYDVPAYQDRLTEIVQRIGGSPVASSGDAKRGA